MTKPAFVICEQQRRRSRQHSLISAFVVRYLDSIISLVSVSEISSLYLGLTGTFVKKKQKKKKKKHTAGNDNCLSRHYSMDQYAHFCENI